MANVIRARREMKRNAKAREVVQAMLIDRANYYRKDKMTIAEETMMGTYAAWAVGALEQADLLRSV